MSKKTSSRDILLVLQFILVVVVIYLFQEYTVIAITLSVVIIATFIIYKISNGKKMKLKETQKQEALIQRFGEDNAALILKKELRIGMSAEMVRESRGNPEKEKKVVKTDQITMEWYWGEYEYRNSKKYKEYAIIVNDKLVEFGDI